MPGGRRSRGCKQIYAEERHAYLYLVCALVCETIPTLVAVSVYIYTDNNNALANRLSPGTWRRARRAQSVYRWTYNSGNRYPSFSLFMFCFIERHFVDLRTIGTAEEVVETVKVVFPFSATAEGTAAGKKIRSLSPYRLDDHGSYTSSTFSRRERKRGREKTRTCLMSIFLSISFSVGWKGGRE